jgi:hypothetical protein
VSNTVADQGLIFVCSACGKQSRDRYGDQAVSRGWDESCVLNAVLCVENSLVIVDGRAMAAVAAP